MDKLEQYELLKLGYEKYPAVTYVFQKLCLRYRISGKLQNTIKNKNFTTNDLKDLSHFFSLNNVKNKTVDIHEFILEIDGIDELYFINYLFKITGIENVDPDKIKREKEAELLETLKIKFPELSNTLTYLNSKIGTRFFRTHTCNHLIKACKITSSLIDPFFLVENDRINDFSHLGTHFGLTSKCMRKNSKFYNIVGDFLEKELNDNSPRKKLYEHVGITDNPTAIKVTVFAPLIYENSNGKVFDWIKQLWSCGESATLSMDNIETIDKCYLEYEGDIKLVTCENESPFNKMIQEENDAVIYTAGYPNLAVKKLLKKLSCSVHTVHHWGDSDLDGYWIAEQIDKIIPVDLYRCRKEDCINHKDKLIALKPEHKKRIIDFINKNPGFKFCRELEFSLKHGWFEQESWCKTS